MTRAQRKAEQVTRVDAYKAWLRGGCNGPMPCLPTSADFRAWHDAEADMPATAGAFRDLGDAARAARVGSGA